MWSLRQYNARIPVVVFTYDDADAVIEPLLAPYDVRVVRQGSYERRLAQLCPDGWAFLIQNPVLHKHLNFAAIGEMQPQRALLLDCDTFFFGDVARLFARYDEAHFYAREEPHCSRSPLGYNRTYLDETALQQLGSTLGIVPVSPFNAGVVLLNHGVWSALADLEPTAIAYAWRLALWLATNPSGRADAYGERVLASSMRQQPDSMAAWAAASPPLPFPSSNQWIFDEIALWLALGHLPWLRYSDFSPQHVLQGGEALVHEKARPEWVLYHYFSANTRRFEEWLSAHRSP